MSKPGPAASILALLGSMVSIQVGAALAQHLFPLVGAQGTTALRVGLAALILLAIRRPRLKGLRGRDLGALGLYGACLGLMNLCFYLALRTVPLGVAVAVEFTGPLVVAAASQRSRLDILWLVLAASGLLLLTPLGGQALDPMGLLLALGAGVFWGLYIPFGQAAARIGGGAATAFGMVVAAVIVIPFGVASAGMRLLDPAALPLALAVAVLSSALPYSLEMFALPRLPRATFGTLMSLEPAIGALSGFLLLGQQLSLRQGAAIAAIIAASAGAALRLIAAKAKVPPLV
ncbi:MAG: EamA family transporter [Caulobacteraceae bacterium]